MVTAVTAVNAGRWGDREVGHSRTAGCAQDSGAATNPRFSATPQPRLCARRPPTLSHHAYPRAARSVPAGPVHRLHRAARRPHPGAFLHLVRHRPRVDPPASPTASTQLGFAVQLGYARLPGRVLRVGEEAHPQIVATLASQLDVDPAAFAIYLHGRDSTRREHLLELQRDFGFRSISATIYRELAGWLLPIALSTDVGPVLVGALVDELRERKVLAPALSTIERLAWETRRRAERLVFVRLTAALTKR